MTGSRLYGVKLYANRDFLKTKVERQSLFLCYK